jgi:hypothetical protein
MQLGNRFLLEFGDVHEENLVRVRGNRGRRRLGSVRGLQSEGVQGSAILRWIGRVGSYLVVWDSMILPIRNVDVKRRDG